MAEFDPSQCPDDTITCNNNHLTLEQLFRALFTTNEDGCLELRTSGSGGGGGGGGDASAANQSTEIARLSSILSQLDITQTAHANLLMGASSKDLTTLDTLLNAKLDITQTAHANLLRGAGNKDLTTLDTLLAAKLDITQTALANLIKGSGGKDFSTLETLLSTKLDITLTALANLIKGAGAKDFTTLDTLLSGKLDITQTALANLLRGASNKDLTTLDTLLDARFGILTETAPATDTASAGINGRLQRIAQRLTSLIGLLPTALAANGGLKIEGVSAGVPVNVAPSISATDSGGTNFLISNANDTGAVIKASAGGLQKISITNQSPDFLVIKFYNKATAPTSADVPVWLITVPNGVGSSYADEYVVPIWFSAGISVRCVTGVANASTTSPATAAPFIGGTYK